MNDENAKKLGALIAGYQQKMDYAAKEAQLKALKKEDFNAQFLAVAARVIKPALEELQTLLQAAGHHVTIDEQKNSIDAGTGKVAPASISITLVPKDRLGDRNKAFRPREWPETSFIAEVDKQVVTVFACNIMGRGGSAGTRDKSGLPLERITTDWVQEHVIQTLSEAFSC
jgi:hypothetical protein